MEAGYIDQEFKVKFKNADGEIREELITVKLEVECESWTEWCHGPHTITVPIDESVEKEIENFLEHYTLEDIQEHIDDDIIEEVIDVRL